MCVAHIFQNQQRELTVRHARETEKEMKKRLDVQKDEYEETVKRHLSFIDQVPQSQIRWVFDDYSGVISPISS